MRYAKVFLLILFLAPTILVAKNKLYDKLNKLYSADTEKCLALAKKHISNRTDNAAPYYFACIVYKDKYVASSTMRSQYSNLNRSVGYAHRFNKRKDFGMQELVKWSSIQQSIEKEAVHLLELLIEAKEEDRVANFTKKINRLNPELEVPEMKSERTIVKRTIKMEEDKPTVRTERTTNNYTRNTTRSTRSTKSKVPVLPTRSESGKRLYNGLPSGKELITSANPKGEKELIAILNKARKEKGMEPLEWDEELAKAARYHAYDMATQNYFEHGSHDRNRKGDLVEAGGTFTRIKRFYKKSFVNSENIAAGNATPKGTYTQWYNSPGHYKNMFNKSSRKVGVGVYYDPDSTFGYYWVFCSALD